MSAEELHNMAIEARKKAYAPYSKFEVGAAVLTEEGNVYLGCNVENAALGDTICAERNAITSAVQGDGNSMKIKSIAVYTGPDNQASLCGSCRQVINEFKTPKTTVIYEVSGELREVNISELLPESFDRF